MLGNNGEQESELDKVLDRLSGKGRLDTSDYLSSKIPPAQAAEAIKLGVRSSLPIDSILRNVAAEKADQSRLGPLETARLQRESPVVADWAKEPAKLAAGRQDLGQLERIEGLIKRLSKPDYRPSTDEELRRIAAPGQSARADLDWDEQVRAAEAKKQADEAGLPWEGPRTSFKSKDEMKESYTQDAMKSLRAKERFMGGDETQGTIERLSQAASAGFERGAGISRLGKLARGAEGWGNKSPEVQAVILETQKKLANSPQGMDFATKTLFKHAEFFGQWADSLELAALRANQGAILGVGGAAAGGPFTATAGFFGGVLSGAKTGAAEHAYLVEGGNAYLELSQIRGKNGEEIPESTKQTAATFIGFANAGMEMLGLSLLTAPARKLASKYLFDAVKDNIAAPTVKKALGGFMLAKAKGVTGEVVTETLQEGVNIFGEELSKAVSTGEFEKASGEEIATRLITIATDTLQGSFLLGLPGGTANLAADVRRARHNQESLKEIQKIVDEIKLLESNPEEVEAIGKEAAKRADVPFQYAEAAPVVEFYQTPVAAIQRLQELTGESQDSIQKTIEANGDFQIPTEKYLTMAPEEKTFFQGMLRKDPDDMSQVEADAAIKQADDQEKQRAAAVEKKKRDEKNAVAKEKFDASVARIGEILENAANAAGLSKEVTADSLKLVKAAFSRIGQRTGKDPLALFQKYNLTVEKHETPKPAEGKAYTQPGDKEDIARGRLRLGDNRKMSIDLFKEADKSTFPHEFLGHFHFELLGDIVEAGDAPQEFVDDYRKILDYMGATDRASITEPMHEKWSRTVEKYLEKGEAPSKELRGVFSRFGRWIADIYRNAKEYFAGVEISPELRDVLDRIFATQEAIEEARLKQKAMDLVPEVSAAVKSGLLTPDEGDRIAKAVREDREEAEATLTEELQKDFRKKHTAEWKETREKFREEVTKAANERKEYVAESILKTGAMPDGSEAPAPIAGLKLWRDAIVQMGFVQGTAEGLEGMTAGRKDGAIHPDAAAEMLNYANGYDLVNALANLEPKEAWIERALDAKAEEVHGPPLTDAQIREKAVEALHGEHRRKRLHVEMRLLAEKHPGALKTGIRVLARRVPSTETLREAAANLIGAMHASKVNPRTYQAAEKRAAYDAAHALAKGDIPGALEAKIREAINYERYLAAVQARKDTAKILKHLLSLRTKAARERIGKGNPEHVDQIDKLLERYELKPRRELSIEDRKTIEAYIAEQRANGYEPAISDIFKDEANRKSFKDATINELRDLDEAVSSIEAIAKRDREIRVLNRYLEKEIAVKEMVDRAGLLKDVKKRPEKILRNLVDRLKDKIIGYDKAAVPIESLIEELDGGAIGPWHDYFWNRSSEAQSEEYDLTREVTEKVVKLTEKYMKGNSQGVKDLIQTRLEKDPISRYRLMSIIFNMGTESSLDKMIRGEEERGNSWTMATLLDAASNLSAKDLEYIQEVWKILDTLYPKVAEIEKRVSGVAAPKLAARPFTVKLKDGSEVKMDGGYYPLKYDPELSDVGKQQESGVLAGLVEEGYTPATTPASHRKARTGFAAPLLYDFGAITQKHLAGVIKDISHREFLIDAQRLLRDPRIRRTLQQKLGPDYEALFKPWLKSIAADGITPAALTGFSKGLEKARSNVTTVALGYKFGTMLAQLAGLPNAFEYIQSHYGSKYFMSAWHQFSKNPLKTYEFIVARSGEMRNRWQSLDRDARLNLRDTIDIERGPAGTVVRFKRNIEKGAYVGINIMDRFVSVPTWMAAYNAVMEKALTDTNITEDHAIHAADAAVRRSQGAGGAKDLSEVQRERGAAKIFTMFMTPFIAQYGRIHNLVRGFREAKGIVGKLRYTPGLAFRIALITMIPAVISEFLTGRSPEDESAEEKAKRYAKRAAWSLAAPLPYIRELANTAERIIERDGPPDVRVSPVIDAFEKTIKTGMNVGKATFGDNELDDAVFFDALEVSGYLTGTPTSQPRITMEYLYDMLTGDVSPEGPGQLLHDLLFRRPNERNPRD